MFRKTFCLSICVVCVCRTIAINFEIGSCSVFTSEKCLADSIEMYLFTSERPDEPIHLKGKNLSLPDWVNLNRTNKLIAHGYGGNLEFFATKTIRNGICSVSTIIRSIEYYVWLFHTEYLRQTDTNVFVVDWGKLASFPCYPAAAINTKFAAKCAADLLMKLERLHSTTFRANELHGIGFSLGAHFISSVSNRMYKTNGRKLQRITGKSYGSPLWWNADIIS